MRDWPKFVCGEGYVVAMRSSTTGEAVALTEPPDEQRFVAVRSENAGPLFDDVLGRVIYALSEHSDDLLVDGLVDPS